MDKWMPLINLMGLVLVAFVNYWGNRNTHNLVNSRMTELLELTRASARAEGAKEEFDRSKEKS